MHPILVELPMPWGTVPIYSYGVMLGTSLIVAWYFIMWMGPKKEGLSKDLLANTFLFTAVFALLGSRVLYIVTNPDEMSSPADWFDVREGGLVAYGGFLGGFFSAWTYLRRKGVPLLAFADVAVITLGSGLFFTRIGCWLYGCDFGRPLAEDAPGWLAHLGTFPKWDLGPSGIQGSPAFHHHMRELAAQMGPDATASLPVHPTQLYESAAGLCLFVVGYLLIERRAFRGQVLLVVTALYSLWRFAIEYVRDDPGRGEALGFSTSQLISLLILPICLFAWIHLKKRHAEVGDAPIPASALEGAAKAEAEASAAKETEAEKAPARKGPKKKKRPGKK